MAIESSPSNRPGRPRADIRPFEPDDAPAITRLSPTVQWPSLTDPAVVERVCTAPGSTAYVAEVAGGVVAWAQALGDGVLQSHLSLVAVDPGHRHRGITRPLVVATFQGTGTLRMDLVTDSAPEFYATFAHQAMRGFRIYPRA